MTMGDRNSPQEGSEEVDVPFVSSSDGHGCFSQMHVRGLAATPSETSLFIC